MRGGSVRHRRRQDAATPAPAPDEAALDDFLAQADTWFWATDARHRLTLLTPAFQARTGMAAAGLIGRPLCEVAGADPLGAAGGLEAVLAAGAAFADLGAWLGAGAGGARAVVLSGWPVRDSRGRFAGYRGSGRARPDAETGDGGRTLRDLLRVLTHELSAPLGTVIGMSELLLGGDLATEQRRYASAINGAGGDLLAIANELLDLSRPQTGEATVEAIDFDLAALVEGQVTQCAARARHKGVEVRATFGPGLPPRLVGDPWRLRQIIAQVLGGAIATAEGEVTFAVTALPVVDGRPWIRFETGGGGETSAPVRRLFQAPGRSPQPSAAPGSLALCMRLVGTLGGRMGRSTSGAAPQPVWIELPFAGEGHRRAAQPLADHGLLAGLPVMLIEGSPVDRQVMTELLRRAGARIEAADSLEAAVASSGGPVAVIAVDARLTRGGWRDARRRLAMHPRFADAACALLDPRGAHGHAHRARAAGFAAYLAKPVRPAILTRAVAALADRRRRAADGDGEGDRVLITRHVLREWARSGGERLEPAGVPDHSDAISREILGTVREALGGAGLCDLVQRFGEDARDRLERIRAAAAAGETAAVVQALYDLRSTTGSIGATRLFAAAEALLKRCRGGAQIGLEGPLAELEGLLCEALTALDAYARQGPPG